MIKLLTCRLTDGIISLIKKAQSCYAVNTLRQSLIRTGNIKCLCVPEANDLKRDGEKVMTEKELRKLKRSELLEIMYYLQKELDTVKTENESLKQRLEKAESGITPENLEKIISAVKSAAEECFRGQSEGNSPTEKNDDYNEKSDKGEQQRAGKQKNG